ncbi:hypothetical protein MP638_000024 [Amoeboaphelidium occidentale]|nr:hypothetical protein MP638_000024 [Amoeboaphelidium occidentale]
MSFTKKAQYAAAPATTRGQAIQLSADPKNEKFLYTNGRTVVIRDLKNPAISSEYTEHPAQATVAKWSPSGYYIASGDVQGNIRIWDATQETHIIKTQTRPLSSRVNDIAWDSESKRLIVGGDGKERYGHAIAYDTGNSVGEIVGHNKVINSVDIRVNRPFKAVTCSDDLTVNFYAGPPYKFVKSINDHTRFVQAVRFSPSGALFASVGSDAKIFLYDGTTADKVGEISDGHTGGIFAVGWSPDSKTFLTSSADSTVKFWDASTKTAVNTVAFTGGVDDQQVGNLWAGSHILSVSLNGNIHYLDPRQNSVARTVYGHQKAITSFATLWKDSTFFTGSYDGRVYQWNANDGLASPVAGQGHTNQVSGLQVAGSKIVSIGMDDSSRTIDVSTKSFEGSALATESQPKCLASFGNLSVLGTLNKELVVVQDGKKVKNVSLTFAPTALAFNVNGSELAVGGEDCKVRLYAVSGTDLTAKSTVLDSNRGAITALSYSPDGKLLAVADTDRKVLAYDPATGELKFNEWVFQNARVNCVAWSPDGLHAVSGGLDRDVYVWSVEKPMKSIAIKGAHQEGVTGVSFSDNNTVVSTGQDASVKVWSVVHH